MTTSNIPTRFLFSNERDRETAAMWIEELMVLIYKLRDNKKRLKQLMIQFFNDEKDSIIETVRRCNNWDTISLNSDDYSDTIPFYMKLKTKHEAKSIGNAFDYVFKRLAVAFEYTENGPHVNALMDEATYFAKIMGKCHKLREKNSNKNTKKRVVSLIPKGSNKRERVLTRVITRYVYL